MQLNIWFSKGKAQMAEKHFLKCSTFIGTKMISLNWSDKCTFISTFLL